MTWNELMVADSRQQMQDFIASAELYLGTPNEEAFFVLNATDPVFREEVCALCGRAHDWVEQAEQGGNYRHRDCSGHLGDVCDDCADTYLVRPKDYWRAFDSELLAQSEELAKSHPVGVCRHCGDDVYNDWLVSLLCNSPNVCQSCFKEHEYTQCHHCGHYFPEEEMIEEDSGWYCEECHTNHLLKCDECGELFDDNDLSQTETGYLVCEECKDEYYFTCDSCGDLCHIDTGIYISDHGSNEEMLVCEHCYDTHRVEVCDCCENSYYTWDRGFDTVLTEDGSQEWCHNCVENRAYWNDDEDSYCEEGYVPCRHGLWGYHDYHDDWAFHKTIKDKDNSLYMGVELEIDEGGEDWDNAVSITDYMGFPCDESSELKCSCDGSLDEGFEIITMPCTLQYHRDNIDWAAGMGKASRLGYTSHDAGTCGLHVHVNRSYFKGGREDAERKFTLLMTNNQEWLKIFSRRTNFHYCEFCDNDGEVFSVNDFTEREHDNDASIPYSLESLRNRYNDHYKAINFKNQQTIEFRLFRGTLIPQTFYASLELVQMLCDCVQRFSYIQLCYVDFKFLYNMALKRNYQAFIDYSKARGLTMLGKQSVAC